MNVEIKFDAVIRTEAIEEIASMVTNDYMYGLIDEESAEQMDMIVSEIYDAKFAVKPDAEQPHDTSVKDCTISFKVNVGDNKENIEDLKRTVDHHLDYLIDNVHEHTDIVELHNASLIELDTEKEKVTPETNQQYEKMVEFFKEIMNCSERDVEELFDPKNNINVADTFRAVVENTGELPSRNDIYIEAVQEFCFENDLEYGKDVEIHANSWADTNIYIDEKVSPDIVGKLCDKMNMEYDVDVNVKIDMSKKRPMKTVDRE